MPKLLICCDEYIFHHNGNFYAANQEKYDFFQRYLRVFEEIRLAIRCIDELKLNRSRILLTDDRIEIIPLPIFHGPLQYVTKYFATGKAITGIIDGCAAAVLRLPSTVAQRIGRDIINSKIPYAVEVVFDAHDGANTAPNLIQKILWTIIDKRMRKICYKANGVSCVTEHYLQKRYFSNKEGHFKSHYSSLALDKSFFTSSRKYPDHQPLKIAHVDDQIGLFSRKGTAELMRAIKLLKDQEIVVEAEFAGDDWDNSTKVINDFALSLGIEKQVKCIGYLNRKELDEYLNASDLFVLPTKAEGLPRVIIEAIAKGLPTVTTPASGNPELIPEHFLVDYDDVETLAERIKELITDKVAYEKASRENFLNSLHYEASIMQARRDIFYGKLKEIVNQKQ